MRQSLQLAMVAVASFAISACSMLFGEDGPFRDRTLDYQKAETYPRMEMQESLAQQVVNDYHSVPDVDTGEGFTPTQDQLVPKPRMLVKVLSGDGVEIRRDGDKDWLWIEYPPEDVWPIVKGFFKESGVELAHVDDSKGQLETVWLEELPQGSGSHFNAMDKRVRSFLGATYYQKFRVDMMTNKERDVTGLLLSRAQAKKADGGFPDAGEVEWQTQSKDEDLRAKIVQKLGEVVLARAPEIPGSGLVQNEDVEPRIAITRDGNGYPVLVIGMDFNRAWESVGRALRESNINVVDLNRSLATYYLDNRYTEGEDEPEMIELKLNRGERNIHVAVQKDDNTLMNKPVSEQILSLLKDNLG